MKKLLTVLVVLTATACSQEEGQRVPIGEQSQPDARAEWPAELTTQVDSANLAYANGDYETAAAIYRSLTDEHPDIGTVWFGLYMAEDALGNSEEAAAALEKAESITPGLGQMHDAARSEAQNPSMPAMPSGHPPLDSVNPEDAPPLTGGTGG
jgi:tetratricopeptide (TPR) repeat protein